MTELDLLNNIYYALQILVCMGVVAFLIVLSHYTYKFFNIFFKIK